MNAVIRKGSAFLYDRAQAPGESDVGGIVDEVFCGWPVRILGREAGWCRVRTFYGYEGYLQEKALTYKPGSSADSEPSEPGGCGTPADSAPEERCGGRAGKRQSGGRRDCGRRMFVAAPFSDVLAVPLVQGRILLTAPRGAILRCGPEAMHDKEGKTGRSEACGSGSGDPEAARSGYLTVQLPDGRYGYAAAAAMGELPDAGAMTEEEIRGGIVLHALSYLGTQYRWGGKSPAGIDCSGLAFMSCLLTGIPIYRDAAMPEGFPVHAIPKEKLRRGDLIYFPGHVAVSLGGERFVHATGHRGESGVVRGSFSPEDEGYRADLSGHVTGYGSLFPAAEMPGLPAVLSLYEGE